MIGAAVPAAVPAAPAAAPAVSAAARADARALDGIELSAVEQLRASVLLAGGARLEESVAEAVAAAVVDGGADEDDDGAGELCGGKALLGVEQLVAEEGCGEEEEEGRLESHQQPSRHPSLELADNEPRQVVRRVVEHVRKVEQQQQRRRASLPLYLLRDDLAPVWQRVRREPDGREAEPPGTRPKAELLRVDRLGVQRVDALAEDVLRSVEERADRGEDDAHVHRRLVLHAVAVAVCARVRRALHRRQGEADHDAADTRHLQHALRPSEDSVREEGGPDRHRRKDDPKDGGARQLEPDRRPDRPQEVADGDRKDVALRDVGDALRPPPLEDAAGVHQHHAQVPVHVGQLSHLVPSTLVVDELHADAPPNARGDQDKLGHPQPTQPPPRRLARASIRHLQLPLPAHLRLHQLVHSVGRRGRSQRLWRRVLSLSGGDAAAVTRALAHTGRRTEGGSGRGG
mmetsp:Transcript_44358/g.142580  ORF Transcript_44358/g.142580 Transcript_44358/m.142580 type:complete len:459 (+) Transcript_44358:892-2268(+)